MKRKSVKYIIMVLVMAMASVMLAGCGGGSDSGGDTAEGKTLDFAYQYGIQYLPGKVVKEQGLIEKYYDGDVKVNWQTLNSGAAVNESIVSGALDGGILGTSVAVTGINSGIPYKIISGCSNIGNKLITNDDSLNKLADFDENDQLALVNTGSIQHITLAMAAKKVLGDAHALDNNIVGMAHPDGMTALLAGSIQAHFTTIPYWNKELEDDNNHEIKEAAENAAPGASIIVTVVSTELFEKDPDLYAAVQKAFAEAMEYVNNEENFETIAEDMYEEEGVTKEEMLAFLKSDDVVFDSTVTGLMDFASFMEEEDFLDGDASNNQEDYVFEGVKVKPLK